MSHRSLQRIKEDILHHLPCISRTLIPDVLTRITLNMEKRFPLVVSQKGSIKESIEVMCRVGSMALESRVINRNAIIRSIILMLKTADPVNELPPNPHVEAFLHQLYFSLKKGRVQLSDEAWQYLFISSVFAVESEVMSLLKCCLSMDHNSQYNIIKSSLSRSRLIHACSTNPTVFRKVLMLLIHAWLLSKGNQAVQLLLAGYISAVENLTNLSIVSLFPENVQHVVILFLIPPTVFCSEPCPWPVVLRALEMKLCSESELVGLLGLFPLWYEELLKHVKQQTNAAALCVFKMLCPYKSKLQIETLMANQKDFSPFLSEHFLKRTEDYIDNR